MVVWCGLLTWGAGDAVVIAGIANDGALALRNDVGRCLVGQRLSRGVATRADFAFRPLCVKSAREWPRYLPGGF